jgi:hypothetical protein
VRGTEDGAIHAYITPTPHSLVMLPRKLGCTTVLISLPSSKGTDQGDEDLEEPSSDALGNATLIEAKVPASGHAVVRPELHMLHDMLRTHRALT